MRIRELVIGVFLVKLALFGFVYATFGERIMFWGDAPLYVGLAENMVSGKGFSDTNSNGTLHANTERLPLYPALIAVSRYGGGSLFILGVLQALVGALLARSAYVLSRYVLDKRYALGIALVVALEPITFALGMFALPDIWFVLTLLLHIEVLLRYRDAPTNRAAVLVGASYVLALYTKPIMLYFGIVSLMHMAWSRRKLWHMSLAVAVACVFVMPWMWRVHTITGQYRVTTNDEKNFCAWGLIGVLSTAHHLDSSNWAESWALPGFAQINARCTGSLSAVKLFVTEYPVAYAKTIALATLSFFTNEGYGTLLQYSSELKTHHNYLTPAVFTMRDWRVRISNAWQELSLPGQIVVVAGKVFWLMITILAILGFVQSRHWEVRERHFALLCAGAILYFAGVAILSTAFGVSARLRVPIITMLFIFSVAAIPQARRATQEL